MPPTKPQFAAAKRYVDIVVREFRTDKGVHAETAIAAAARMAGTFLFRSFNFPLKDIEPGSAVLSDAANDHGPLLIQTLGAALNALRVELDQSKLSGGVPDDNRPHVTLTETQARVESSFRDVSARLGLTAEQSAHACALAAAQLIQLSAGALDPNIGFSVAAYGFVEGAKTAPVPFDQVVAKKRPWYRFWG